MRKTTKIILISLIIALTLSLCSCIDVGHGDFDLRIMGDEITLTVGEEAQLVTNANDPLGIEWSSSSESVTVSDAGLVSAVKQGNAIITASFAGDWDSILIIVTEGSIAPPDTDSSPDGDIPPEGENPPNTDNPPENNGAEGDNPPPEDEKIPDEDDPLPTFDPYIGMTKEEFYQDYKPATNYVDAYYRTQHCFMSGSISAQDQEPSISDYRPTLDGLFVKNTSSYYADDGNTYYIVDADGEIVGEVFRDGAYVTLEEVAAYVYAFGTVPPNYITRKNANPQNYGWGEYLRLNHSKFSGDTSRYPYEPELPRISGCGGDLIYYEIDIGTTGTDCDPSYDSEVYNDGYRITRGAARIVYTMYDADRDGVVEIDEHYLFYTYNHYNDFQEYLNYLGGWGEMFGNITGGGQISSKTNCNPTPYVSVAYREFGFSIPDSEVAFIFKEQYYYTYA